MRTLLIEKTQIVVMERVSSALTSDETEEWEKKEQTELEEWASKVQKEAVGAAAAMGGELKLSGKETLEIRLKQLSDEVTQRVQERLRKEQETKSNVTA